MLFSATEEGLKNLIAIQLWDTQIVSRWILVLAVENKIGLNISHHWTKYSHLDISVYFSLPY